MNEVLVSVWSVCENDVHVRFTNSTAIHSRTGDLVHGCTVAEVVGIGQRLGYLKPYLDRYRLVTGVDCREFCDAVESVRQLTGKWLSEARGQIESAIYSDNPVSMDDWDVAVLDYLIREMVADRARETEGNPWDGKIQVDIDDDEIGGLLNLVLSQ